MQPGKGPINTSTDEQQEVENYNNASISKFHLARTHTLYSKVIKVGQRAARCQSSKLLHHSARWYRKPIHRISRPWLPLLGAVAVLLLISSLSHRNRKEERETDGKSGEWRARDTMLTAPFLLLLIPSLSVSLLYSACSLAVREHERAEAHNQSDNTVYKWWRTMGANHKEFWEQGHSLLLLRVAPACRTHRYTSACWDWPVPERKRERVKEWERKLLYNTVNVKMTINCFLFITIKYTCTQAQCQKSSYN